MGTEGARKVGRFLGTEDTRKVGRFLKKIHTFILVAFWTLLSFFVYTFSTKFTLLFLGVQKTKRRLCDRIFSGCSVCMKKDISDLLPVICGGCLPTRQQRSSWSACVFLPSLYAWFNIAANMDPYGNTSNIKVAIANCDAGASRETMSLDAGGTIVDTFEEK